MSRSTIVTIAAGLAGGALLALLTEGAFGMSPEDTRIAGGMVLFIALCSVAWHGPRAAIARHEDTTRTRRHRREPIPRRARPVTADRDDVINQPHQDVATPEEHQALAEALAAEPEQADAAIEEQDDEPEPAEQPAPARAAFEEYPGRAEILAAKRAEAAAHVDPYLQPADGVGPDEWPTQTIAVVDPHADLYGHAEPIRIPADTTVLDGWDKTQLDVETYLRGEAYVRQPSTPATP